MDQPSDAEVARLRRDLARKGVAVNERLVALLAGKDARLLDLALPHERRPGLRPEERLRAWLDQISRAQRRLGTPAWGRCQRCGAALDPAALGEQPWLEECRACADPA